MSAYKVTLHPLRCARRITDPMQSIFPLALARSSRPDLSTTKLNLRATSAAMIVLVAPVSGQTGNENGHPPPGAVNRMVTVGVGFEAEAAPP